LHSGVTDQRISQELCTWFAEIIISHVLKAVTLLFNVKESNLNQIFNNVSLFLTSNAFPPIKINFNLDSTSSFSSPKD